jgi:hypothetical protein
MAVSEVSSFRGGTPPSNEKVAPKSSLHLSRGPLAFPCADERLMLLPESKKARQEIIASPNPATAC